MSGSEPRDNWDKAFIGLILAFGFFALVIMFGTLLVGCADAPRDTTATDSVMTGWGLNYVYTCPALDTIPAPTDSTYADYFRVPTDCLVDTDGDGMLDKYEEE